MSNDISLSLFEYGPYTVEVTVDSRGNFSAYIQKPGEEDASERGEQLVRYGRTFDQTEEDAKLELRKRKVRVQIPFITFEGKAGVATGIHATTGNVTVQVVGNTTRYGDRQATDQWSRHREVLKHDTDRAIVTRIAELTTQAKELTRERDRLVKENSFDLGRAVEEAVLAEARQPTATA